MPVLVRDPLPAELEALLERRRATGADRRDEIWDGVLHMAPAPRRQHADIQAQLLALLRPSALAAGLRPLGDFNLGGPDNYRIPDAGLVAPGSDTLYLPTAAVVIEASPHTTRPGRSSPSTPPTKFRRCSWSIPTRTGSTGWPSPAGGMNPWSTAA